MTVGQFIGRQPQRVVIAPSRSYPWYGNAVADDPLTTQQRFELDKRRLPQDTERMTVYRQASQQEMYWPQGSAPPVFEFECPVLGRRAGGGRGIDKIKVLAPNGEVKMVFPDGWVSRPHRLNRTYIESRKAGAPE